MKFEVDGRDVFASHGGREHRTGQTALVLIHGSGTNHTAWALQNRFLAHRGINVFSVDLPGHGRSAGPPLETVPQLSDWLVAFLRSAGISKAFVLGHSLGALVALHFGASHPADCEGILLSGVAGSMAVHPDLLKAAKANDPLAIELVDSWCHASDSHLGGNSVPGSSFIGGGRRLLESENDGVLYADLNACDQYKDAQENFDRLTIPVTVIAAAKDKMTPPRAASKLAASVESAQYVLIDEAGHNMMLERPDKFNDVVRDALGV